MRRVLVLGGGDGLGGHLCRALAGRGEGVVWQEAPAEPDRPADAAVYLGASRSRDGVGPDLADAGERLEAWLDAGVAHVVLVSSAAVNPPEHRHPGLVGEERVARAGNPVARRWREIEERARRLVERRPGVVLTTLRPTVLPVPAGRDYFSRLFAGGHVFSLAGHDPSIQVLSLDDLAEALARAVERRVDGTFNVAPRAPVPLRQALRLAGCRRWPVPRWLQRAARSVLARAGWTHPPACLEYIRYSWTVSDAGIRARLGFVPRRSSVEALVEHRRRRGPRPDPPAPPPAGEFDDFGQDTGYIDRCSRTLFRFEHDFYWRIETEGLEHVPRAGPAVLVGAHRGFMPFDGTMALHIVARGTGRYVRFLVHPALLKFPFLCDFMTKLGGMVSCPANADHVLRRGELLGVFPEGIRGAFTLYRDAYRLGKFGRDEYVKMALRNRAPIVPFVTIGSAEIFPILARIEWRWWKRYTEWPFFPLTPTFPLLPLPLPSKWHTRFLPPLHVEARHPPAAARDPEVVQALGREVRERMQAAWADMLGRRRSIFFGSIFEKGVA